MQNFQTGIEDGTFQSAKRGRGRNPFDASAFEKIIAMPIFHGDDVEIALDMIFRVEELGEFTDGEAVTNWQREISGEGSFAGIENRAFDNFSAERIGTIENVESDVALSSFLHAIGQGGGVGVKADASVLHIEDESVDTGEHFVSGAARVAIEAVDGKASGGIVRGREFFVVASGEAVFGTEERDEVKAGSFSEQVDDAAAVGVEASVIGDEADVFAAEWRELLRFENVEAGLHASGMAGMFFCGSGVGDGMCGGGVSGEN